MTLSEELQKNTRWAERYELKIELQHRWIMNAMSALERAEKYLVQARDSGGVTPSKAPHPTTLDNIEAALEEVQRILYSDMDF